MCRLYSMIFFFHSSHLITSNSCVYMYHNHSLNHRKHLFLVIVVVDVAYLGVYSHFLFSSSFPTKYPEHVQKIHNTKRSQSLNFHSFIGMLLLVSLNTKNFECLDKYKEKNTYVRSIYLVHRCGTSI